MENKGIINFMDFFKENPIKLESDFNKEDFKDFFTEEETPKDNEIAEEKLIKMDELMKKVDSLREEAENIETLFGLEKEKEKTSINNKSAVTEEKEIERIEEVDVVEDIEEDYTNDDDNYYPLYKDKAETFSCDIAVEGANLNETQARLIVESDEWTLMFEGEIDRKGKCNIPINKLSIFNEGTKGKIRLEVIAEGTVFSPWKDEFKVKMSKKVSIKMNESRTQPKKKEIKKPGISVNVRR